MSLLFLYRPAPYVIPGGGGFAVHVPSVKRKRKKRIFYVVKGDSGRTHKVEAKEIDYSSFSKEIFKVRSESKRFEEEEALLLQMMLEDIV